MKRVYVVYGKDDVPAALSAARDGDCIFGDAKLPDDARVAHVSPELGMAEKTALSEATATVFDSLRTQYGEDIDGFANTFFLATVHPIAAYAHGLDSLLTAGSTGGKRMEVVFPCRFPGRSRTSTFFLAEHEAQRIFLYPRYAILQPYLEDVCRSRPFVTVRYAGKYRWPALSLQMAARRYAVFALRLCFAVSQAFLSVRRAQRPARRENVDIVAISRLPSKSEYLHPLLTSPRAVTLLLAGENFSSMRRNYEFCKNRLGMGGGQLDPIPQLSLIALLYWYATAFAQQFRRVTFTLDTGIVRISIGQGVREMLVNYPDLRAYSSVMKNLVKARRPALGLVVSTELISQYAYADAKAAREAGAKCVHMMDCDLAAEPLPRPVYGDLLVVDTPENLRKFRANWPRHTSKLAYFGTLRKTVRRPGSYPASRDARWCFFTSAQASSDQAVVRQLLAHDKSGGLNLTVKLHPRDSRARYIAFPGVRIVAEGQTSKQQLFEEFDFGLCFNSAIIKDLLAYDKPFLLLDFQSENYFNQKVHSDNLNELVIGSLDDLPDAMAQMNSRTDVFRLYRNRTIGDDVRVCDIDVFLDHLLGLGRRHHDPALEPAACDSTKANSCS